MSARQYVDFNDIAPSHQTMHGRLLNWGRACHGGRSDKTAPIFRLFQPSRHWHGYGSETPEPVDRADAVRVSRGVCLLPEPHRLALQWCYVKRTSVADGRRRVGCCTAEALARYVTDGRQMLINRGV